ncbi:hypothetical protein HDU97_010043 [Phlyctochytrium planicorne]|nr:hypothetical protein HDU97_010043 [Phlyctochytrium planicorne]
MTPTATSISVSVANLDNAVSKGSNSRQSLAVILAPSLVVLVLLSIASGWIVRRHRGKKKSNQLQEVFGGGASRLEAGMNPPVGGFPFMMPASKITDDEEEATSETKIQQEWDFVDESFNSSADNSKPVLQLSRDLIPSAGPLDEPFEELNLPEQRFSIQEPTPHTNPPDNPFSSRLPISRRFSESQAFISEFDQGFGLNKNDFIGKRRHSQNEVPVMNRSGLRDENDHIRKGKPYWSKEAQTWGSQSMLDRALQESLQANVQPTAEGSAFASTNQRMLEVSNWTPADVMAAFFLAGVNELVFDILLRHNITGSNLITLNDSNLLSMGILSAALRREVLDIVDQILTPQLAVESALPQYMQ